MRASTLVAILNSYIAELGNFEVVVENHIYSDANDLIAENVTLDSNVVVHVIASADDTNPNKEPVYFIGV